MADEQMSLTKKFDCMADGAWDTLKRLNAESAETLKAKPWDEGELRKSFDTMCQYAPKFGYDQVEFRSKYQPHIVSKQGDKPFETLTMIEQNARIRCEKEITGMSFHSSPSVVTQQPVVETQPEPLQMAASVPQQILQQG